MILLGYGQEIVRSVYNGETDLPPICWLRALRDGGLFLLTGLLYLTPIVPLFSKLLVVDVVLRFLGSTLAPDSPATLAIRALAIAALALLVSLIILGVHLGGVRHALGDRKGLLGATGNAKLLLKHRALSGRLILNIVLLGLVGIVAASPGAVFFLLPGLCLFVACSLGLWYLLACYGMAIRIHEPGAIPEGGLRHGWLRATLRRRASRQSPRSSIRQARSDEGGSARRTARKNGALPTVRRQLRDHWADRGMRARAPDPCGRSPEPDRVCCPLARHLARADPSPHTARSSISHA